VYYITNKPPEENPDKDAIVYVKTPSRSTGPGSAVRPHNTILGWEATVLLLDFFIFIFLVLLREAR
jgi:hypothetical protein